MDIENGNISNKKAMQCVGCCTSVCLLIFTIPFIICDLYFATNMHCGQPYGTLDKISMNLWLYVTCGCAIISLGVIMGILCCGKSTESRYFKIFKAMMITFEVAWFIVGAVKFWDKEYFHSCEKNLQQYLFVRIICGLITINIKGEKKE